MTQPETINYAYTPREVAERFLTCTFPNKMYRPRTGPRASEPSNTGSIYVNTHLQAMHDEGITGGDKVRYLSERTLVTAALIVANIETGLTPQQERFALYTSAASRRLRIETDILRYEMEGKWYNIPSEDHLRPHFKKSRTDADYLEELKGSLEQTKRLQQELMEASSPPPDKER